MDKSTQEMQGVKRKEGSYERVAQLKSNVQVFLIQPLHNININININNLC